jgi:hypothetical protein
VNKVDGILTYDEFLQSKAISAEACGFDLDKDSITPMAFDYQRDIIAWACKKGKCAILTGCGTGKTLMLLEWARAVHDHTDKPVLVVSPLSVVHQTVREGEKFGICAVNECRRAQDVINGVNITNYEMIEHFDSAVFAGVVLDESSILKSFTGKYKTLLTDMFCRTPYRLLCTATIAPNDYTEIGTSCEFLGIMSRTEMLATYFIHDSGDTSKWRLKKAGVNKFWEWFATWAIYFNSPKDLGYEGEGYDLPPLNIHKVVTKCDVKEGEMLVSLASTLEERREARKDSAEDRTDRAAALANGDRDAQWLLWCDYNDESAMLKRKAADCVEVKGSDEPEFKAQASMDFADGRIHALVSKPSIFGFGSNFQSCHSMVFCGLSDSYERFYQAVRRCWRFGQEKPVDVYIILSEREMNVLDNITRKQQQMDEMQRQMTALMKEVTLSEIKHTTRITTDYKPTEAMEVPGWIA